MFWSNSKCRQIKHSNLNWGCGLSSIFFSWEVPNVWSFQGNMWRIRRSRFFSARILTNSLNMYFPAETSREKNVHEEENIDSTAKKKKKKKNLGAMVSKESHGNSLLAEERTYWNWFSLKKKHSSSSSSSCRTASMDIPNPLSPLLPIIHRIWATS